MIVALQWIKQGTNRGQPSIEKGGGSVRSLYLTGSFDPLKSMSHRGRTPCGFGLRIWDHIFHRLAARDVLVEPAFRNENAGYTTG